jgi:uncharacterized protein YciW
MMERPLADAIDEMIADPGLARLRRKREDIVQLTQRCHEAVLTPHEPGGLSHALRAALAGRMARLTGVPSTLSFYEALVRNTVRSPDLAAIATGQPATDPRLAAIVAHVDRVTTNPHTSGRAEIASLVAAGVAERDIVALSELIAFLSYQFRVVRGLELLRGAAA